MQTNCLMPRLVPTIPLFLAVSWFLSACDNSKSELSVRRFSESELRSVAIATAVPTYPRDSGACGVAVGEIEMDGNGIVTHRAILQAPDVSTGNATLEALEHWKFKPVDQKGGVTTRYVGKLTFYFRSRRGESDVPMGYDADESPNISDCIDRLRHDS
jgi:hypothetical protein